MVDEIIDEAAGMTSRQAVLALGPTAPALAKGRLDLFLFGRVELVRGRERQLQRRFELAEDHVLGHELRRIANGAEPLVVEVIRHTVAGDGLRFGGRVLSPFSGQVAELDVKPIGADVARRVWSLDL